MTETHLTQEPTEIVADTIQLGFIAVDPGTAPRLVERQPPLVDRPRPVEPVETGPSVADLLCEVLQGLHTPHGYLVRLVSTTTSDGLIVCDVTRLAVSCQEMVARVVLTLSAPLPMAAAAGPEADAEDEAELETSAT